MRNWDGSLPRASSDHHDSLLFCCFLVYDALYIILHFFQQIGRWKSQHWQTCSRQSNSVCAAIDFLCISCSCILRFSSTICSNEITRYKHVQPDVQSMHCRTFLDYWCFSSWFFHTASNDLIRSLPSSFQQMSFFHIWLKPLKKHSAKFATVANCLGKLVVLLSTRVSVIVIVMVMAPLAQPEIFVIFVKGLVN